MPFLQNRNTMAQNIAFIWVKKGMPDKMRHGAKLFDLILYYF